MNLDLSPEELSIAFDRIESFVQKLGQGIGSTPVFNQRDVDELRKKFRQPLPESGCDIGRLIDEAASELLLDGTFNLDPRFFANIMSGGNHAGMLAELMASAINRNASQWHRSATAAEMECQVLNWLGDFIGYGATATGTLTSGGSAANLTALALARRIKAPYDVAREGVRSSPRLTIYVSEEGHHSLDKAVDLLGLGSESLRRIECDKNFRIRTDLLLVAIDRDRDDGHHPIAIIGNAGTVNTGAIDPLGELAEIARKKQLWFHVDAAYGGPAAAVESERSRFEGLELADSVTVDPHKWLYVPYEAGCLLTRDAVQLKETFKKTPAYLLFESIESDNVDFMDRGWQLSRCFKALKVWMTFRLYGRVRLARAIEDNISVMKHFASLVETSNYLELMAPHSLSIVCFRYNPADGGESLSESNIEELNRSVLARIVSEGKVFLSSTRLNGKYVLRACCVNHRTEPTHVEDLLQEVEMAGRASAGNTTK